MSAYLGTGALGPLLFGSIGVGLYLTVYTTTRRRYDRNWYERMRRGMGE